MPVLVISRPSNQGPDSSNIGLDVDMKESGWDSEQENENENENDYGNDEDDEEDDYEEEKAADALVSPGELITQDTMWMRGHGTYSKQEKTFSSVVGTISKVNKLLSVQSLRGRYVPVIGDHVIGRISEVGSKRWKVDIGANLDANLLLGSVNLPGGILRRKSESDELQMRQFLKEGDLLNAEVQALYGDNTASLHTRSLRYGKLRNGFLVQVPSSLVMRLRTHQCQLPGGVDMILGINGYIWLSKSSGPTKTSAPGGTDVSITRLEQEASFQIYSSVNDEISTVTRENIARYANCIEALAYKEIGINEARLIAAYEASLAYQNVGELVQDSVKDAIALEVLSREE